MKRVARDRRAGSRPKKVPVVLQTHELECGAACLAMICRAHGIPATLADCRQHLPTRDKGVTALSLSKAALKFGLRARAYSAKSEETVKALSLPAIVHFDSDHFVVLEGWAPRRDTVFIADPAAGRRKLDGSEFLRRHSGVALTFEPNAAPPVSTSPATQPRRQIAARLLQVPGVRRLAAKLLAATLSIHLLALTAPLMVAAWVDSAATSSPAEWVNAAGAGAAGLALALIVLGYLRSQLLAYFGSRLGVLTRHSSCQEILALPSSFLDPRGLDDETQRLLGRIRRIAGSQAVAAIVDGSWVLVPLLALWVLEPRFFGLAVAAGVLHLVLRLGSDSSRTIQLRNKLASGIEPEDLALNLLNGETSDLAERAGIASGRAAALSAVRAAALLSVLWIGTHLILQHKTSLGTVLASVSLTAQFLWAQASLISAGRRLGAMRRRIDTLARVIEGRFKGRRSGELQK